jgi:hypothetical protein
MTQTLRSLDRAGGPSGPPSLNSSYRGPLLRSGDDVGDQVIFELGDLVLEPQLALLEPRDLKLVAFGPRAKCLDRGIEIAVLLPQQFDSSADLGKIHAQRPLGSQVTSCPRRAQAFDRRNLPRSNQNPPLGTRSSATDMQSGALFTVHLSRRRPTMETSHLNALRNKHAGIDARLSEESRRPFPDTIVLARLKKEKLQIKQEIAGLN